METREIVRVALEVIIAILGTSGIIVIYLKQRIKVEEGHNHRFREISNDIDVQKAARHTAEVYLIRLQARIIQGEVAANGEYRAAVEKFIAEDEKLEELYKKKAVVAQSVFKKGS